MSEYVVELKNATKRFPGVVALRNMQLAVKPGEILGLIGENGAGKSTLIKVLTGVHQADEGQIFVDGVEQHFKDPNESAAAGIACVYQELNIEKLLSITDNIFINKWLKKGNLLDYPTMHKKAKEVMASLGQDVDPTKPAGNFGMGVQQMIEIAKAVEEIFGVKVAKVNTLNMQGKLKRMGARPAGRRPSWKKAMVTLTADSKAIEFFEGMV